MSKMYIASLNASLILDSTVLMVFKTNLNAIFSTLFVIADPYSVFVKFNVA